MKTLLAKLRAFAAARGAGDETGVAAVEFALIVPILITLYLGMVEFSLAVTADRKVTTLTSSTADLVARSQTMNSTELNNIFEAATAIMTPYDTAPLKIVVTSVSIDADGDATVAWSEGYQGGAEKTDGASVTLPNGLAVPNTSVIMAEVSYDYNSALNYVINAPITLGDTFYMRPRAVASVVWQ